MARLSIRKVAYRGEKWSFESPWLGDGLQILVGRNGAGKSTFSNLIYYCLGGRVTSFEQNDKAHHREIVSDSKNYVELLVEIDSVQFRLKRYFNSNEIGIQQANGDVEVLSVTRSKDNTRVFSDWMLERLGIDPVTLYYGAYVGKINLTDLFRLIYHDQSPDPSGIFKRVDRDSFVTDSSVFKKAVFELLLGKSFQDYYTAAAAVKRIETERNSCMQTLEQFKQFVAELSNGESDDKNLTFINAQISETKAQLQRAIQFRNSLQNLPPSTPDDALDSRKRRLFELTMESSELREQANQVTIELARLQHLYADMILEVTQIKKAMFTHDSLDLFSANTCPYCLNEVKRVEGKCVCGASVDETAYERFFYDNTDYLAILKSKQKNVQTIQVAIEACRKELRKLGNRLSRLDGTISDERAAIREATKSSGLDFDANAITESDSIILRLRSELAQLDQKLLLERKRQELEEKCSSLSAELERAKAKLTLHEAQAQQEMERRRGEFAKRYTELLSTTVASVRTTALDESYMPIINQGEYREASAAVAKRLMYYLTLLSLSLEIKDMAFPRFLLIDTPQTAGIDPVALQTCIDRLKEVVESSDGNAQIILTIGDNRLTTDQEKHVFLTIPPGEHILRTIDK